MKALRIIAEIILYIWQLPQNLLGLLVILFTGAKKDVWDGITYYNGKLCGGVSLGNYIIIDRRYYNDVRTPHHEHGHQIQSKYLGILYLILIGIPSGLGNLIFRIPYVRMHYDYYSQPWERWADKLGGVQR